MDWTLCRVYFGASDDDDDGNDYDDDGVTAWVETVVPWPNGC